MARYFVQAITARGQQFTLVLDVTSDDIDGSINEAANDAALELDGTYAEVQDYALVTEH